MSKKTNTSPKNKKTVSKKVVKKTSKTVVKAKPVKKTAIKTKIAPKKVNTPKKVVKKTPVKKIISKKIIVAKKKPVKKTIIKNKISPKKNTKAVVKKVTVKKTVVKTKLKPKKAVAKKIVIKTAKKIAPKKAISKKVIVAKDLKLKAPKVEKIAVIKEPKIKVEKVKVPKPAKIKPVVIKKPIVAPTTFRKAETGPIKFIKEPNGKFEMEFVIRASEDMVFEFVSTESGLSEWFCDDVTIRDGIFTFDWDGQIQEAKLIKEVPPTYIRYQWMDKNDGSYFEFRTQKDELTNDISLIITDFADNKAEEISSRLLWESQVDKLLHVLGSFF